MQSLLVLLVSVINPQISSSLATVSVAVLPRSTAARLTHVSPEAAPIMSTSTRIKKRPSRPGVSSECGPSAEPQPRQRRRLEEKAGPNPSYFAVDASSLETSLTDPNNLIIASRLLHERLKGKTWKGTNKQPVACSYGVLEYAWDPYEAYTRQYGGGRALGRALVVGMNPGPWGMVQTGVPFGEVEHVRDWLGVSGVVGRPSKEHPKRPVEGFSCKRSEVSGKRLWGFFKRRFGTADAWGDKMFAYNYCPLTFMSSSGGNITPDKLPPGEREVVEAACNDALVKIIAALRPRVIIGVGNFAGAKCLEAVTAMGLGPRGGDVEVEVVVVNHPSPASPSGVKWERAAGMDELVLGSSKCKEIDRFLG